MRSIVVIFGIAAVAAAAAAVGVVTGQSAAGSILQSRGDVVRIHIFDAFSGEPIANTDVVVSSDNGMRCEPTPCPTNDRSWNGKTGSTGQVAVPRTELQASTDIETAVHASASLTDDAERQNGVWVVDLTRKDLLDSTELGGHPFKLIDAATNKAIAGAHVRVFIGSAPAFETRTSPRGYFYIPNEKVMLDIDRVSVVVAGYQRARLDFAAVRFKTRLQPK